MYTMHEVVCRFDHSMSQCSGVFKGLQGHRARGGAHLYFKLGPVTILDSINIFISLLGLTSMTNRTYFTCSFRCNCTHRDADINIKKGQIVSGFGLNLHTLYSVTRNSTSVHM